MKMGYRPNYLLGGYVMPHLSTWQAADMLKFVAREKMVGFDYDSLWAQWATKGPMYYVHMRLAKDPAADVATLRKEYFSAFGPAAEKVEKYFDYWEDYSATKARNGGVTWNDPTRAPVLYPPEAFAPALALLKKARERVAEEADPQYLARVDFLQVGLDHARLSVDFIRSLGFKGAIPSSPERLHAAQEALAQLIKFRRAHEKEYFADLIAASTVENRNIDIDKLVNSKAGESPNTMEKPTVSLDGTWLFRKDPDNRGLTEQWFATEAADLKKEAGDAGKLYSISVPSLLQETEAGEYHGYGWYFTTFDIPQTWRGEDIHLNFGAVDEQAWIYVNGEYVGEHTVKSEGRPVSDLYQKPFVIRVSEAMLRPGINSLVVRIHSEAGASGVWGPVSLNPVDDL